MNVMLSLEMCPSIYSQILLIQLDPFLGIIKVLDLILEKKYTYHSIAHFQDDRQNSIMQQFTNEPTTSLDGYVEASLLQKVWNRPLAKPSPDAQGDVIGLEPANSKVKWRKIRPNQICSQKQC